MTKPTSSARFSIGLKPMLLPLLIAGSFAAVAGWSVQSLHRSVEERFLVEALSNCKVMDLTIAGETTMDEGVAGIQQQIDAVIAEDPRIVRLSYVGRAEDGRYLHLASSQKEYVGTPAHADDLEAIHTNRPVLVEEEHGSEGAVNINYPAHDPSGKVCGAIGYTISRQGTHAEPVFLASSAVVVMLVLCGYFFVQIRRNLREIEERRRIETELRDNDRIKNDFISTSAHELRTPLTAVLGYTELLLDPPEALSFTEAERREFLEIISNKGNSLARIVDNLLDLTRIQNGRSIPLELGDVPIRELLDRELCHYRPKATRHCFELSITTEEDTLLHIDRQKVSQVIDNLLSNAVKFSPRGGTIRVCGQRQDDVYLVTVQDEGIGMSSEESAQVFEKFYRANTSNTAAAGLGLGMSIVREIVTSHGGQVWLESTLGRGTTVFFTLPLAKGRE